jgi:cytochrome P450
VPLEQAELPYLDLAGSSWAADPWAEVRRVRASDPRGGRLARSHRGIEILSYADFAWIMRDKRLQTLHTSHWEEQGAGPMTLDFVDNGHLLTFDPERHLRVRRIMTAAFRLSHIEERRRWFHELAQNLIGDFADAGRCDLVGDFSHKYSIAIICRMIGVPPQDIPAFERATLDMALMNADPLRPVVPRLEAALTTIWEYSVEIVARRRAERQEDFISGMIAAQESEGKLTEHETVWAVANLLFAGHDTTRYQLAAAVQALVDAGAWEDLASDPGLAPAAVEEAVRLCPVVLLTSRVVVGDDVVVDGVHMPPDTILRCNWFAFNRDPERFPAPDRLDLRRDDFKERIPFGSGVHKCLGHALARADIEVALEELSAHLTDVRIAGDVPLQPFTGAMGGPKALPLTFKRRDPTGTPRLATT